MKTALLLVLATALMSAQNVENFLWWNRPIRDQIGLTSEQNDRIRQIVRKHRNHLLDARNDVLKAEGDLGDVMNGARVDASQAKAVIDRLAHARAISTRAFLEMSVELRSVLTLDQWRQLVKSWDEQQRKRPKDTQIPP
ncbi:MAG TPA: periplasmic heavy metal sensor [Bryobacteraceae bacterium]|jgi:Spy/CpxP family protein refolding chaperone